ncbi:hypothetical protein GCM10010518_39440 [Kitasatospora cinereorecta]
MPGRPRPKGHKVNHPTTPPPPDPVERLAAVVCDQDRGESPFGWSEPPEPNAPSARPW